MKLIKRTLVAVGLATSLSIFSTANAAPINYGISWTGSNNWTMAGEFSIDDSLLGSGAITANSLLSMSFTFFLSGVEQGNFVLEVDTILADYNFNFDTTTEQLLVGGLSNGPQGQDWNRFGPGYGWQSGNNGQRGLFNGGLFTPDDSFIFTANSTLAVVRLEAPTPVSVPGSMALMVLGLISLLLMLVLTRRSGSQSIGAFTFYLRGYKTA